MATIVLTSHHVANTPDVGGHFWVYLQYALGLQQHGCELLWVERVWNKDPAEAERTGALFLRRMEQFGFAGRVLLLRAQGKGTPFDACTHLGGLDLASAEAVFRRADLLLNFHYAADPHFLARFRRTALVDIDPGLLQHWINERQLAVAEHDHWFTTGERVGVPRSLVPSCGKRWVQIRPCVSTPHWPVVRAADDAPLCGITAWDGGEWVRLADGTLVENNKRLTYLEYRALARHVSRPLELAIPARPEEEPELELLRREGWRIRPARAVASSPGQYQAYVQQARGEFGCCKPSCLRYRTAWVSDRTLCFLSSGKPAVVQHTGPSSYLPDAEGLFRFTSVEEAAAAIAEVDAHYERHCEAARALAEEHFDARKVTGRILDVALGSGGR